MAVEDVARAVLEPDLARSQQLTGRLEAVGDSGVDLLRANRQQVRGQLGHSSVTTTETHYARWCSREAYREPMRLEPGEVPADLLTRITESRSAAVSCPRFARAPSARTHTA